MSINIYFMVYRRFKGLYFASGSMYRDKEYKVIRVPFMTF